MFDPVGALLEDAVEPANTDAVGLFTEFLNDTLLLRTEPPSDGECTSPLLSGEGVWAQHTPLGTRLPPPLRADDTLRSPPAVGRIVAVAALERLDRSNKRARGSGTPMGMGSPVSTVQDLAALDEHRCAPAPSPRRLTGSTGSGTSSPASARGSPQPAGVPSRKNRPQRCCKPRRAHQPPAPGEAASECMPTARLSCVQRRGSQVAYLQIRAGERLVAQLSRSRTPRRSDALCDPHRRRLARRLERCKRARRHLMVAERGLKIKTLDCALGARIYPCPRCGPPLGSGKPDLRL